MSFGKMNQFIEIRNTVQAKDADGFMIPSDSVLANVSAYKEDRHSNEKWANMAAFSSATALFRFRMIPNLKVTTELVFFCNEERFQIVSVEDVRNRGMYLEILAEKIERSKK
jgi:head-tail adaptor